MYQIKDYQQAIEACKNAININPNLPNPWFNLGLSYQKIKDYGYDFDIRRLLFYSRNGSGVLRGVEYGLPASTDNAATTLAGIGAGLLTPLGPIGTAAKAAKAATAAKFGTTAGRIAEGAVIGGAGGAAEGAVIGALLTGGAGPAAAAGAPIGAIAGLWWSEYDANLVFKRSFSNCLYQRGHFPIN